MFEVAVPKNRPKKWQKSSIQIFEKIVISKKFWYFIDFEVSQACKVKALKFGQVSKNCYE